MVGLSPGLSQEGPVGRELVLEDESKLVLVGALLAVGRRVPEAAFSEVVTFHTGIG